MTMKKEKRESKMRQRMFNITSSLFFFLCQTYIVNQKQSSASTENKEQARKQGAQLGVGLN